MINTKGDLNVKDLCACLAKKDREISALGKALEAELESSAKINAENIKKLQQESFAKKKYENESLSAQKDVERLHVEMRAIVSGYNNDRQQMLCSFNEKIKTERHLCEIKLKNEFDKNHTISDRCLQLELSNNDTVLELLRIAFSKAQACYGPFSITNSMAENIINASALFDDNWYKAQASIPTGVNPLQHYLTIGSSLGYDPHPLFSTIYYVKNNLDVAINCQNPLVHYILIGYSQLRDPHPFFSTRYYLDTNLDIFHEHINPLTHFCIYGGDENRNPHPIFDSRWYRSNYMSDSEKDVNPLIHFVRIGEERGNDPGPLFSNKWYAEHYNDVRASIFSPIRHYLYYGQYEYRQPGPNFDPIGYLNTYTDIKNTKISPLEHYLRFGKQEGRQTVFL